MQVKTAIKTLLRIINEHKKDNQQVVLGSEEGVEYKYTAVNPTKISEAAETIYGIDGIVTIECADANIWFTVYADPTNKNADYELICDYNDNKECKEIEKEYKEYFKD